MKPGRWIALAIASLGGGLVLATLGAARGESCRQDEHGEPIRAISS